MGLCAPQQESQVALQSNRNTPKSTVMRDDCPEAATVTPFRRCAYLGKHNSSTPVAVTLQSYRNRGALPIFNIALVNLRLQQLATETACSRMATTSPR